MFVWRKTDRNIVKFNISCWFFQFFGPPSVVIPRPVDSLQGMKENPITRQKALLKLSSKSTVRELFATLWLSFLGTHQQNGRWGAPGCVGALLSAGWNACINAIIHLRKPEGRQKASQSVIRGGTCATLCTWNHHDRGPSGQFLGPFDYGFRI